jgi:hypothetical protein
LTKQGYTALVFVVDASGSMWAIHHDMEGAIEAVLAKQKALPGKLTVDMVYFDAPRFSGSTSFIYTSNSTHPFQIPNGHRPPLDNGWYQETDHLADPSKVKVQISPGGGTALYDALGTKITSFGKALANLPEDERPEQVIFAIVTDGEENSSVSFNSETVKGLIEHQTNVYGWNFTYLGANQDAVLTAQTMGIAAGAALTWNTNNVAAATQTMDSYVTGTRTLGAYSYTAQDRADNA